MLVLTTLGAPERRRFKDRKGRQLRRGRARAGAHHPGHGGPRASVREPRGGLGLAGRGLRGTPKRAEAELASAAQVLARALHAHRVAHADPHARDVSAAQALVVRIGYGDGDAVAEGRYEEAWELPRERRRTRRSMEAPEERFAALLGAREEVLACEELVLRVRADLDAGRVREAALGARVALESVLAELAPELAAAAPGRAGGRPRRGGRRRQRRAARRRWTRSWRRRWRRPPSTWRPRCAPGASTAPPDRSPLLHRRWPDTRLPWPRQAVEPAAPDLGHLAIGGRRGRREDGST